MMEPSYFLGIAFVWGLAVLFATSGRFLLRRVFEELGVQGWLATATSYYAGLAFFLCAWRIFAEALSSARGGAFLATALSLALGARWIAKTRFMPKFSALKGAGAVAGGLLIHFFCTFFWSRQGFIDAYSTIGSGHSPRYANIAIQLIDTDRIPVLGMNYAQSLLSALPSYVLPFAPLLYLSLWLGFSLIALAVLTFQLLRWLGAGRTVAALGTAFVLCSNSALSSVHYLIIDSGSPFYVNGYSDTLHSIGILFSASLILMSLWRRRSGKAHLEESVAVFSLFFSSLALGPQSLVVLLALGGALFLTSIRKFGLRSPENLRFARLLPTVLLALGIGRMFGGALTPVELHDKVDIPGVERISREHYNLYFSPGIPYLLGNYRGWTQATNDAPFFTDQTSVGKKAFILWRKLLDTFQVLFFPLLGFFLIARGKDARPNFRELHFLTSIALFCGFALVWPFFIYGSKWLMTRFLIPGVYLGQLALIAIMNEKTRWMDARLAKASMATLLLFGAHGPAGSVVRVFRDNSSDPQALQKRFDWLTRYRSWDVPSESAD